MKIQTEISASKYVYKRGILLYLTFIALEVKANRCLCLLYPSAVPGEVSISPLVHVRTGNGSINRLI